MLDMVTSIGVPAALLRRPGKRAKWKSPDRGIGVAMPERPHRASLSQRRTAMPIIDSARLPLEELPGNHARRAWWGLWLKLLRPLGLLVCWCAVGYDVWRIVRGDRLPRKPCTRIESRPAHGGQVSCAVPASSST
ncbi:MAG TPA: hypothetical protein VNB23_13855 [Ramlibacter sp.]|nr:hypothetical protein [Ramlibacter sp.]